MRYIAVLLCSLFGVVTGAAGAEEERAVVEVEVDGSIDQVWAAFTTAEGLKTWTAPLVEIELKVGGKWRSNYNADGRLGDAGTIENTILSYDPGRMLSLKATKFPAGFPFVEAAKKAWSVFYFSPISDTRTRITAVGLGYDDSEESQKMRSFFAVANKQSLAKLNEILQARNKKSE